MLQRDHAWLTDDKREGTMRESKKSPGSSSGGGRRKKTAREKGKSNPSGKAMIYTWPARKKKQGVHTWSWKLDNKKREGSRNRGVKGEITIEINLDRKNEYDTGPISHKGEGDKDKTALRTPTFVKSGGEYYERGAFNEEGFFCVWGGKRGTQAPLVSDSKGKNRNQGKGQNSYLYTGDSHFRRDMKWCCPKKFITIKLPWGV